MSARTVPQFLAAILLAPVLASAAAEIKVVSRTDPEFPREAMQAGADKGYVKARMTLDAAGEVTRVDILDARPRRLFDRAVTRSLAQWRYENGPAGRTVEVELEFRR
jgi:periplasmic protein TonB